MKRALIVGIDDYDSDPLKGCVLDAKNINKLISKHEDGSPNFDSILLVSDRKKIEKSNLKKSIEKLFECEAEMALFYFSGHGFSGNLDGFIVTQDVKEYDKGVSMQDILKYANESQVKECVLMLDCCYSGKLISNNDRDIKGIREGITILTASRPNEYSIEGAEGGLFTSLVCDALNGSASDLLGTVTTASIYSHVGVPQKNWTLFKLI